MHSQSLAHLALFAVLTLTTACGGAQKPAMSPDVPAADSSASTGDTQLPDSALAKADEQKVTPTSAPPPAKPESTSAAEEAIISGNALPPSPKTASAPKAAKPTKVKKPARTPKKTAQASRG